ncbi:MAG TPA: glycosyltransferase [Gammaproteobacteria bacterium]|nr:glycosyltransferase [Gammaproteobacteria bacterium]
MIPSVNILGTLVSAVNPRLAIAAICHWIETSTKAYVCVRDVHGIIRSLHDPKFKKIQNQAGLCIPDGMPTVLVGRYYGHTTMSQIRGADLMNQLSEVSVNKSFRHFYYGGKPGVADLLKHRMQQRFPGLQVVGTYSPPFRPLSAQQKADFITRIEELAPDIIWVGLSTPKQEYWMAEYLELLNAKLLIGVGAAFDFHAGLVKEAPKWMQQSGFEWLFRLYSEPRRLWKRYFVVIPLFLFHLLCQLSGLRKYSP